jgi:tRNA wybutosine-synthesizing protein 4
MYMYTHHPPTDEPCNVCVFVLGLVLTCHIFSDVLPWQCLTRYAASCRDVKFIDIDFPDLMEKKRGIIHETAELNSMLTNLRRPDDPLLMLDSDQYAQMGCDLRDLDKIQQSMSKLIDMPDSEFIFVAEVSITYMETRAADAVISWANSLGQGIHHFSLTRMNPC